MLLERRLSFCLCCCCLQAYIENFLKEQEDAKAAARAAAKAEEQRIQDYWAMVAQRDAEEAARKAARKDAADRIYDQLRLEQEAALRAKVCAGGGHSLKGWKCAQLYAGQRLDAR
jgi:hypothetical protein